MNMQHPNSTPENGALRTRLIEVIKTMSKTKHNRFQAAKRLSREHNDITFIISFCSVGVIASSLVLTFFPTIGKNNINSLLGFFNIIFSICILALTLLQDSRRRLVQIELLRRSGIELIALIQHAKLLIDTHEISKEDLKKIIDDYVNILNKFRVSHSDEDNMLNEAKFTQNIYEKIRYIVIGKTYYNRYRLVFIALFSTVSFLLTSYNS